MTPDSLPSRFAARIYVDTNRCWIWGGAVTSSGYGSIGYRGVTHSTHRLAYALLVGPIPEGLAIDHVCRVKRCCNPDHLEAVTYAENNRRAIATVGAWRAKVTACRRGHEYTEENTYTDHQGYRQCRTCRRASNQAAYKRRRENPQTWAAYVAYMRDYMRTRKAAV